MKNIDSYEEILLELSHQDIVAVFDSCLSVNEPDDLGNYLLNIACSRLQTENVKFFLLKGASVSTTNQWSRDTPLLCTIDYVHHNPDAAFEIASLLLDYGADIEARGYMDKIPFLKACTRGDINMLRLLAERGCNIYATVKDLGYEDTGQSLAEIFNASSQFKVYLRSLYSRRVRSTKRQRNLSRAHNNRK